MAGGAEFCPSIVEGIGENGEDDAAIRTADEIEAAFLLDELEMRRHPVDSRQLRVNSERAKSRSLGFARDDNFFELTD